MPTSPQKVKRLDKRYITTQKALTKTFWPFLQTATNVYQTVENTLIHNSLFCHHEAEGYSTIVVDGVLQCYCWEVGFLIQVMGLRADFHVVWKGKGKGKGKQTESGPDEDMQVVWEDLLVTLKDADEESWCKAYRHLYKFAGDDEELKQAMSDLYEDIFNELVINDDESSALSTSESIEYEPDDEEEKTYLRSRETDNYLDRMVQEDIRKAVDREERALMEDMSTPGSGRGKRVLKKPLRYKA